MRIHGCSPGGIGVHSVFGVALQSNRGRLNHLPIGLTVTHHMDGTNKIPTVY